MNNHWLSRATLIIACVERSYRMQPSLLYSAEAASAADVLKDFFQRDVIQRSGGLSLWPSVGRNIRRENTKQLYKSVAAKQ